MKSDGSVSVCAAKGSLKIKSDGIVTGDFVNVENGVITGVLPRKNRLKRPNVANIDLVAVVVGRPPEPDYYLIDKIIGACTINSIDVAVVVNKLDLENAKKIESNYSSAVSEIFRVSAKTGEGIDELFTSLKGKLVVFTGQSAVGKTSILNKIFGENRQVGELSKKTERGKQTTTVSEIIEKNGVEIADTPGFSSIDLALSEDELPHSYPEFLPYLGKCRFSDCRHVGEPDCAVKNAVAENKINKDRYSRYVEIYKEIKNGKKR